MLDQPLIVHFVTFTVIVALSGYKAGVICTDSISRTTADGPHVCDLLKRAGLICQKARGPPSIRQKAYTNPLLWPQRGV